MKKGLAEARIEALMKHLGIHFEEKVCETCEGQGEASGYGHLEECYSCDGAGVFVKVVEDQNGRSIEVIEDGEEI